MSDAKRHVEAVVLIPTTRTNPELARKVAENTKRILQEQRDSLASKEDFKANLITRFVWIAGQELKSNRGALVDVLKGLQAEFNLDPTFIITKLASVTALCSQDFQLVCESLLEK